MKKLIITVILVVLAGIAAFFLKDILSSTSDKGQVIIGIGQSSLETSFFVFAIALTALFVTLHLLLTLLWLLFRAPKKIKLKQQNKKESRSSEALVEALIDSAEGNWEQAEQTLVRHAATSQTPLIHYLTAANAAQSRGAIELRDQYLRQAYDSTPNSDLTVGLKKAELHLSQQEYDQALSTLTKLDQISPSHATVQKLLHTTYSHLNNWEAIRQLLPNLKKNKSLMDLDIQTAETQAYSELLKQSISNKDLEKLQTLWKEAPAKVKQAPGVDAIYFAGMSALGASASIEGDLLKALGKDWDETILVLLEAQQPSDPEKLLKQVSKFLKKHPEDPILLRVLGRLSINANQDEEAQRFLSQSLQQEASVSTLQMLGDLCKKQGKLEIASEHYRNGLLLASEEVVRQVQTMRPSIF